MSGDEAEITDAGCDGYISKPLDLAVVLCLVKKFIGSHSKR